MKLWIKNISYKTLIASMITIVLSFFCVTSVSHAKLKLEEGEFYYSGTQEAELVVEGDFWDNLLKALGEIANYILGIMTLGTRGVIVGWIEIMEILLTAVLAVPLDFATFISNSIAGMDEYSQQIVNVESIIFNEVPVLQANIFKNDNNNEEEDASSSITSPETIKKAIKISYEKELKTGTKFNILMDGKNIDSIIISDKTDDVPGKILKKVLDNLGNENYTVEDENEFRTKIAQEITNLKVKQKGESKTIEIKLKNNPSTEVTNEDTENVTDKSTKLSKNIPKAETSGIVTTIRTAVAKWYYVMRLIIIVFMLLFLIFIGIKIALSTIASEKALYKNMLADWVVGMIIIFMIHYIMVAILNINDSTVDSLRVLVTSNLEKDEYETEDEEKTTAQIESSLYETIRTRAYSLKLTDGFAGLILYGFLVYYAWKFALIYFKRLFNIIMLTLLAPVVSGSYALNKVITGKSKIFNSWLTEYVMNVIIQIIHVIIYASFMTIAIKLSTESISGFIITIIVLNFMSKADKILRELFKLTGGVGSLVGEMADRTNFREIKHSMENMKNAMVGGVVTKEAMKLTYGAVAIPFKKVGMSLVKQGAKVYANSSTHTKWMENKENKSIEEANDFLINNENSKKIFENHEKKRKEIFANKSKAYSDAKQMLYLQGYTDQTQIDDNAKDILGDLYDGGMEKVEDIDQYINNPVNLDKELLKLDDETEEKLKKEFLIQRDKQADDISISDEFKENFDNAIMGLLEKQGKKYVIKKDGESLLEMLKNNKNEKYKEVLSKYINNRIERKKANTSYEARFKENMRIKKLFGLSDDESSQIKGEIEFWKNRIISLISTISGMSILAANPFVAVPLLVNGQVKKMDAVKRRRIYESRATSPANKVFKFGGLGINLMFELGKPEMYQQLAQENLEALHNKKFEKKLKNDMKRIQLAKDKFDEIKKDGKDVITQYNEEWKDLKKETEDKAKAKNISELAFEQKLSEKNTIDVGNGICMQIENNQKMKDLFKDLEKIDNRKDISKVDKINLICKELDQKSDIIVQDVIMDMCAEKGITDISKVKLQDNDIEFIKHNIEVSIEKTGIIERGEIDLSKTKITEQSINDELKKLKTNENVTNEKIEEKVVSNAILEYMQNNSIQNVNDLKNDNAKDEIYDIIKDKLMSESTKQSAKVIMELTGQNKTKDEIKLSQNVIKSVDDQVKNVKKTTKVELINHADKDKLIEKQVKRETNQIKQDLEKAVYTDNQSVLDITNNEEISQKQLELLMLLNTLKSMNQKAEELGPYITIKNKKKTKEKYQYYTDTNIDSYSEGQKIKANSELSELDIEIEGPVVNIVDLINNIGNK